MSAPSSLHCSDKRAPAPLALLGSMEEREAPGILAGASRASLCSVIMKSDFFFFQNVISEITGALKEMPGSGPQPWLSWFLPFLNQGKMLINRISC